MKSSDVSKAILVGIAVTVPIVLGIVFNYLDIGLAICFGAFWSSPSNTAGSYHHKKLGILFSAALVTVVSFIGGYLNLQLWFLIPIIGALTFTIAYLSIYGFRASLISFSGLLALVLSFAFTPTELAPYQYALLVGVGGLWYLLLVIIAHQLNPKGQTEESLSETFDLTAQFLDTRAQLLGGHPNRKELQETLHKLQTDLIEHHETLRDILIASRKRSGNSKYQNRQLLIFVQLVEILETAIANPVDYEKLNGLFKEQPKLKECFQELIYAISNELKGFAQPRTKKVKTSINHISQLLRTIEDTLKDVEASKNLEQEIILKNLLKYQEKQVEKLKRILQLLDKPKLRATDNLATSSLKRFLVPQDYDLRMGLRNFTFKSAIFKHSLRLAVTMMLGFLIGRLLEFQNPYWILLTIIVIMRPSYGLTKARSKDRIIGTLIGAVIAAGVVLLVENPYVLGGLGIISLVVAFSVVQKNYKVSATFVTLSVVFIYAILRPDVLVVVQYRILDTLIGASLAFMAILWLWPAWGFLEIRENMVSSSSACQQFFERITTVYIEKTNVSTGYKVTRKKAFLETSNLNAAFQRMAQEPKSKQKKIDTIYEIVVLNHTMLSSLASLSTYLQHHQTTPASQYFKDAVRLIDSNLSQIITQLENTTPAEDNLSQNSESNLPDKAGFSFSNFDIKPIMKSVPAKELNYQETHLIWEQLRWLNDITTKIKGLAASLNES